MPKRKVLPITVSDNKPSLASLKMGTAKTSTAQKRAIKKIEAHVSNGTSTRKTRIVVKKTISSDGGLQVKRIAKGKQDKYSDSLALPANMSIRAREKALVILEQFSKDFVQPAERIAYISGLCFILLGSSLSLAFSDVFRGPSLSQSATVSSSTLNNTLTPTLTQNFIPPTISLPEPPIPNLVVNRSEHTISVENTEQVVIKAKNLNTGQIKLLPIDDISAELYKFVINGPDLEPGHYNVRAFLRSSFDLSMHEHSLGDFVVPLPAGSTTTTTSNTSNSGSSAGTDDGTDTTNSSGQTTTSNTAPVTNTASTTTTSPVSQIASTVSLKLLAPPSDLSGDEIIKIETVGTISFIEVYVRASQSSNQRFVGLAQKRSDYWYFFFDTRNQPNGEYEITARTKVSGENFYSVGVKRKILNFSSAPLPETEVEPETETDDATYNITEQTMQTTTPESEDSGRSLPDLSLDDIDNSSTIDEVDPNQEVFDILAEYQDFIRNLLNRYAIAQQSGDPLMIELALKEIQAGKEDILFQILSDRSTSYLADEAEAILDERFALLQKRVDTFEELRRTASNNETSLDTDNDGISDFDEKNLYNSDPNQADTDNDGVLDGIEIVKGYDPTNPSQEAVIKYEMPQDSLGIVQAEVLVIENVSPYIDNTQEDGGKLVQAEIKGRGLPNSYVTLYIFSTPTIVTVRTDDTGAFIYKFDKELEDGEHEVYVAVTDNEGAIVARSNPFRFIKEAEAFTPIDSRAGELVSDQSIEVGVSMNSYNVVIGLGILALGLILLMLGISMREKRSVIITETSHDIQTT